MFCTKCGTNNEDNNAFCKNCGAKLVRSATNNSGVAQTHNSMNVIMITGVAVIAILVIVGLVFWKKRDNSKMANTTEVVQEDAVAVIYEPSNDEMQAISIYEDTEIDSDIDKSKIAKGVEQEIPEMSTLAEAKLLKEQTRAQNKEALMNIIQNDELTEEAKKEAANSMITLTETAQKESDAQMFLEAKGFNQTVVSISGDSADVMVEAASLTEAQTAEIIDIVQRKTNIAAENIIITILSAE